MVPPVQHAAQLVGPGLVVGVRQVGIVAHELRKHQPQIWLPGTTAIGTPSGSATTSPDSRYSAITRAASAPVVSRLTIGTRSARVSAITAPACHGPAQDHDVG